MAGTDAWRSGAIPEFEDDLSIVYVIDSSYRLAACNLAWDTFARANGGSHLLREKVIGTDLFAVIPPPLQRFYKALYDQVLRTGKPVDHLYECSSDTLIRRFHMHVTRKELPDHSPLLILINSLVMEQPREIGKVRYSPDEWREPNGIITMCCHCRRTRIPGAEPETWVWVAEHVRRMPPEVSHGICSACFHLHYGN